MQNIIISISCTVCGRTVSAWGLWLYKVAAGLNKALKCLIQAFKGLNKACVWSGPTSFR